MGLRLRTLGSAELTDDKGQVIRMPTRQCLLALAILSQQSRTRTQLAKLLWPNRESRAQGNSLRALLPHLRRLLGKDGFLEQGDVLSLRNDAVIVDAWRLESYQDFGGDFLPGFNQDWVIDQRLAIRQRAYDFAIRDAQVHWRAGQRHDALAVIARAIEIDPFQDQGVSQRVAWLEAMGQRSAASALSDCHRARVLHEFGLLPTVRPANPGQVQHPLVVAAQWLADHNSESLPSMLCATAQEWHSVPLQSALHFHQRALKGESISEAERTLLEAQHALMLVQSGQLSTPSTQAQEKLSAAIKSKEFVVASKLAVALAYNALSHGSFEEALMRSLGAIEIAERTGDSRLIFEMSHHGAIIAEHVGDAEGGSTRLIHLARQADTLHSEQWRLGTNITCVEALLRENRIEEAAQRLDFAERVIETSGHNRAEPWVYLAKASIQMAVDDYASAQKTLNLAKDSALRDSVHNALAMALDRLSEAYCHLNEFDLAASSYVQSAQNRRKVGSVPSVVERSQVRRTRSAIEQKLGRDAIRRVRRSH